MMLKTMTLHDNIAKSKGQLSVSIIINKKIKQTQRKDKLKQNTQSKKNVNK